MRIATKAILAVGALAAIILGMGVYSSAWMKRLDESDTLLFEEGAKPLSEVDPVVGTKKRWC